jgi:hypothetical protein
MPAAQKAIPTCVGSSECVFLGANGSGLFCGEGAHGAVRRGEMAVSRRPQRNIKRIGVCAEKSCRRHVQFTTKKKLCQLMIRGLGWRGSSSILKWLLCACFWHSETWLKLNMSGQIRLRICRWKSGVKSGLTITSKSEAQIRAAMTSSPFPPGSTGKLRIYKHKLTMLKTIRSWYSLILNLNEDKVYLLHVCANRNIAFA